MLSKLESVSSLAGPRCRAFLAALLSLAACVALAGPDAADAGEKGNFCGDVHTDELFAYDVIAVKFATCDRAFGIVEAYGRHGKHFGHWTCRLSGHRDGYKYTRCTRTGADRRVRFWAIPPRHPD